MDHHTGRISIGGPWLPATDVKLEFRRPFPGLDPVVFGTQAGRAPDLIDLTGLAELGRRLAEAWRMIREACAAAMRQLLNLVRALAPVASAIAEARRERMSAMHREYARRQRARRRRR